MMLAFLLGFASIGAEEIPRGVLPQKMPERRQLAGTGVTSSTQPPTTSSTNPPPASSTTNNNPPASSTTGNGGTTDNGDTTSSQPQSTEVPTSVEVTTTNAKGNTITTKISTNTLKGVSQTKDVQTEKGSDNSVVKVGSKTIDPKTLSHKTTVKQPTLLIGHQTATSTAPCTRPKTFSRVRPATPQRPSIHHSLTAVVTAATSHLTPRPLLVAW